MLKAVTLEDLAADADKLAGRRFEFLSAAADMEGEISEIRRKHMPRLRKLALAVKALTDALLAQVATAPALFVKPKSRRVQDLQYGWRKARGKIEFDDEQKVIARIRKLRPDLADTAIVVKETVDKDVIDGLPADELKRLGISITDAGDKPFVKSKSDDLDELLALALGEDGK